jgi:hypothetical protein
LRGIFTMKGQFMQALWWTKWQWDRVSWVLQLSPIIVLVHQWWILTHSSVVYTTQCYNLGKKTHIHLWSGGAWFVSQLSWLHVHVVFLNASKQMLKWNIN